MKSKAIVALLGLTLSAGAFAIPFVQNPTTPSVINNAPAGEENLQTIANDLFGTGAINVNTGQSSAGMFASTTPNYATSIPTLVAEYTANAGTQSFGIWFGTDTDNVITYDLFLGGATPHAAAGISINGDTLSVGNASGACATAINCGMFTNPLINANSFGFYFQASANAPKYFTLDQLNPGPRQDRVVSFENGTSTNWLFAYEDGTDFDYNDMAVKVESITPAVPEPETFALMLAGFGAMGFLARRRRKS
ncbi:MAG TPA: PEP-CTERM sorting domain-containing protein [Caldimonas sp.]|nr:PEP-CTERM sorting domain-containing protein [Caldimonas sp.]